MSHARAWLVLQGTAPREHSQLPRSVCAWLFASSRRRTMMLLLLLQYRIHCCMSVHLVREGLRVAKASTYCSCLCVYDRWAQQVVGPPVMQPKAGAVKAPELSPRGRGRCSNQISRSCTSWRDTSKNCTQYKSFYTFQMGYFVCRSRHILLCM